MWWGEGSSYEPDILEGLHGHLPHARVGLLGAGLDAAAVGHLVLEGVGPGRGAGGHRGVVVEAVSAKCPDTRQ